MAKYTTEVRTVLESLLGENEHGTFDDVEDVISRSWNLVFDEDIYSQFVYYHWMDGNNPDAPFDEYYYGDILCQNILREFFTREICCESVGLWLQWMNERLVSNLEYIKQLYDAQIQLMFVWGNRQGSKLNTIDYRRYYGDEYGYGKASENLSGSDTSQITNDNSDSTDYDNTNANSSKHIHSDTPQGDFELIDGVEPTPNNVLLYATDGKIVNGGGTDTNDVSANGTRIDSKSQTYTGRYDYERSIGGDDGQRWGRKIDFGGMLMQEYRMANASAFIDTDAVIAKLFSDLFMRVY